VAQGVGLSSSPSMAKKKKKNYAYVYIHVYTYIHYDIVFQKYLAKAMLNVPQPFITFTLDRFNGLVL
jgi:hypothetical protein